MASSGPSLVCLMAGVIVLLLLMAVAIQTSNAEIKQKLYLIQGHKIESEVSAAGQLRSFLSVNLSAHQRCQRYSILMDVYRREKKMLTSFQIANIGMLKSEDVEKRFNSLDIELLRDLYINVIEKYLAARQVDGAMVELYKCLSQGFRSRDAKARSFLNNETLKKIVEQYKSIAEEPVKLLAEQHVKHPQLKLEDLHPTVKVSVAQWYPDDAKAIETLFERKKAHASERSHPAPDVTAGAAKAHAQEQAQVSVQVRATAPQPATGELDVVDDDDTYLGYVFGSIIATYESVPLETSLSQRCRAYSRVVEAERADLLRETYVDELVRGVSEELGKQQAAAAAAAAEPFVPDETLRENFMFVLQVVDPLQGGQGAWTDMVDCVGQWEAVDENAARFLHSPELAKTFEQMLELTADGAPAPANPTDHAVQAEAGAAAAANPSTATKSDAPPAGQPVALK